MMAETEAYCSLNQCSQLSPTSVKCVRRLCPCSINQTSIMNHVLSQFVQNLYLWSIISCWCFKNHGNAVKARFCHDATKPFKSNLPLANVLMAIQVTTNPTFTQKKTLKKNCDAVIYSRMRPTPLVENQQYMIQFCPEAVWCDTRIHVFGERLFYTFVCFL